MERNHSHKPHKPEITNYSDNDCNISLLPSLGKQIFAAIDSRQNFSLELDPSTGGITLTIREIAGFEQPPETRIEGKD